LVEVWVPAKAIFGHSPFRIVGRAGFLRPCFAVTIRILAGADIDASVTASWRLIQASSPSYDSPFLTPEFTQAIAEVRRDVRIAIIEDAGHVAGIFPYQLGRFRSGEPVGATLNDVHGVLCDPEAFVDVLATLRACGLSRWSFHHMLADQATSLGAPDLVMRQSHAIGLADGIEAYRSALKDRGSSIVKDCTYYRRRLERENGPVRFTPRSTDRGLLETLFAWKSAQYKATGVDDILAEPWVREALERIHAVSSETFSGMLSVIHAGDKPIAIHLGMRTARTWNYWFPRHDEAYAKNSPGMVLLMAIAEQAAEAGVRRIEMGYGSETSYKMRFRTTGDSLAAGSVDLPSVVTTLRSLRRRLRPSR
jgi:CelD/BcsL family acetyltransferase involved in cellulose biosynthesis